MTLNVSVFFVRVEGVSQSNRQRIRLRELHGARQVLSSPFGFAPNLKKAVPAREVIGL